MESALKPDLFQLPPVYPITDKTLARQTSHLAILKELVRGGAKLVQIRDKRTPARDLLLDLQRCSEFAERNDILLIINDRCDLVMCIGAAGVHLGQDDLPPQAARKVLGPAKIIGFSTHSPAQVRKSRGMPIQYIGFGPVFDTPTKTGASATVGLAGLRRICRVAAHPVVAIGGIGLAQVQEVLRAGAASAAVISALMKAPSIAREMERFLRAARGRE